MTMRTNGCNILVTNIVRRMLNEGTYKQLHFEKIVEFFDPEKTLSDYFIQISKEVFEAIIETEEMHLGFRTKMGLKEDTCTKRLF